MAKNKKKNVMVRIMVWSWISDHRKAIIFALGFWISMYTMLLTNYNLNYSAIIVARSSVENFLSTGDLEAAIKIYRDASLMELRRKPHLFYLWTWFNIGSTTPNKEPLWRLIRSELQRHSTKFSIGHEENILGLNLAFVDLKGVKLAGCDFSGVDLYKTDFRGADLRGCDFRNAILLKTDFRGADLGAFEEENIRSAKLYGIKKPLPELDYVLKAKRSLIDLNTKTPFLVDTNQIQFWINNFKNEDWQERYFALAALNKLNAMQRREVIETAILGLLKEETTINLNGKPRVSSKIMSQRKETDSLKIIEEGINYKDYFTELVISAIQLQDSTCLNIAVRFMESPFIDQKRVRDELLKLKDIAVNPLLKIFQTGTPGLKYWAAHVFWGMAKNKKVKDKNKSKIVSAIIEELEKSAKLTSFDEERISLEEEYLDFYPGEKPEFFGNKWHKKRINENKNTRKLIVDILVFFEEKKAIPILTEISQNDPYSEKKKNGEIFYPIRERAKSAILKLGKIKS